MLKEVICLLADTGRSRAYLDAMAKHDLLPSAAIFIKVPSAVKSPVVPHPSDLFDNVTPTGDKLRELGIPMVTVEASNINDAPVTAAIANFEQPYVIVSGPPGALLGPDFFSIPQKKYLHVHPGRLPAYRGSTPMYYSILRENLLAATAIFLDLEIDTGEMICEQEFEVPTDKLRIDREFDPWIRSQTLIKALKKYQEEDGFHPVRQAEDAAETYFVIHPVLKHLAILK